MMFPELIISSNSYTLTFRDANGVDHTYYGTPYKDYVLRSRLHVEKEGEEHMAAMIKDVAIELYIPELIPKALELGRQLRIGYSTDLDELTCAEGRIQISLSEKDKKTIVSVVGSSDIPAPDDVILRYLKEQVAKFRETFE